MSGVRYASLPLESRMATVGASDIGCILGLSKWATVEDIWKDKRGIERERPGWGEKYAEWGKRLEPVIVQKYRDEHNGLVNGNPVTVVANSKSFTAQSGPFSCTPDALCYNVATGIEFGLEVKNRGYSTKKEWANGPDMLVEIQCQWSMGVMEYDWWDIAVLFGGNTYHEYTVEGNKVAQSLMFMAGEQFMDDVADGTEPNVEFYSDVGRKVRANLV